MTKPTDERPLDRFNGPLPPKPMTDPAGKPTLGADDPVGWYLCRCMNQRGQCRQPMYWNGSRLHETDPPAQGWNGWHVSEYTDFAVPLVVVDVEAVAKNIVAELASLTFKEAAPYTFGFDRVAAILRTALAQAQGEGR